VAAAVRQVREGMTAEAFYEQDGALFVATGRTSGPWDPRFQHGGPPAALLAHAIAAAPDGEGRKIARISCDILRPIPVVPLRPHVEVVRPGRSIDLVDAFLETSDGIPVMASRAWRLPDGQIDLPEHVLPAGEPPPPPEHGQEVPFFPVPHDVGYHSAMEWRFVRGAFREPGPGMAWMRMTVPLIAGEEPSPLTRVLVAADSASGISATLDPADYMFMNVDLTVHIHRDLVGEWVALDARSIFTGTRTALARSDIYDLRGEIGTTSQTLLVEQRNR